MTQTQKRRLALAGLATLTLAAAGCSEYNDKRGKGDAPVGLVDESPRRVWNNIDGYMNLTAFCIGENGAYTHTRVAAPVIVPDDPNCDEGGVLYVEEPRVVDADDQRDDESDPGDE